LTKLIAGDFSAFFEEDGSAFTAGDTNIGALASPGPLTTQPITAIFTPLRCDVRALMRAVTVCRLSVLLIGILVGSNFRPGITVHGEPFLIGNLLEELPENGSDINLLSGTTI
jgi:hypothetical protein